MLFLCFFFFLCAFFSSFFSLQGDDLYINSGATSITIINPSTTMDIAGTTSKIIACSDSPSVAPCHTSATSCVAATSGVTCAGPGPGGIYCAAIPVTGNTCIACSDASTCTGILCPANKFDDDGDFNNGCEVGCPSVAGATSCTACSSAATCTTIAACSANKFNDDGQASNGCEAGCPSFPSVTCLACTDSTSCTRLSTPPPQLTSVNTLTQSLADGASGIPVTIIGINFADVPTSAIQIMATRPGSDCSATVQCTEIARASAQELTCMYPNGGAAGCTTYQFWVTIAGQRSSRILGCQ